MKRYSTLLFSAEELGLENRKLRRLFGKGRRRNIRSKGFKISQKLFKKFLKYLKCKSRSCFYRLFMSGQENHWNSYNLEKILRKPLEELHLLTFFSKLVTGIRLPKPCNRLHKVFYEKMWLFTIEFEFQCSDTLVIDYQYIEIDYTI